MFSVQMCVKGVCHHYYCNGNLRRDCYCVAVLRDGVPVLVCVQLSACCFSNVFVLFVCMYKGYVCMYVCLK
jgi:hypothetical protein